MKAPRFGPSCDAQPDCVVPPDGECLPKYTLVFAAERSDAPLIAILERNDW